MNAFIRKGIGFERGRWPLLILTILVAGCSGSPEEPVAVPLTINGEVTLPGGETPAGDVYVNVFRAWYGEGQLRHPLFEVTSFKAEGPSFSEEISYFEESGEGLAVHVWLDTDGDGVHCTPTSRNDLSGITVLEELPEGPVSVSVELSEPCRSANWFYPPARN